MRKMERQKLNDLVQLLYEAQDEIKSLLEIGHMQSLLSLLEQCQETAIQMGSFIEDKEKKCGRTISLLEDYCEAVFQLYQMINDGDQDGAEEAQGKLNLALEKIEKSIQNDIRIKTEIAFLPYKASMWDSLESIWLAAQEDENCETFVVPIPYYDKHTDGSFGMMHYEGEQMPSYVPVTHYESYLLEERKPDIVYIHNPYDKGNLVTSVAPAFYSSVLKKHTTLLVYVPYYVTTGGMSEALSLCYAYIHADYIITQSPKYLEFFDPAIPKEKIIPLGSPKFDRIIQRCRNTEYVPVEWKEKAKGKTVYFYNTSIGGMLADTRKFLQKLAYVFRSFQGREDACLLWRPHPLLDTTFECMRKEWLPTYLELKKLFLERNLGIYDHSPDIADAIALSDVYLGDSATSVTALFGIAGKPVFLLNNGICSEPLGDDWKGEVIRALNEESTDDWMITHNNHLYHATDHDFHFRFHRRLSRYSSGNYYKRVIEKNGKLYVCPENAMDILVIDEFGNEKRIALQETKKQIGLFVNAFCIGDYIFLIPRNYPSVVRYDIKNEKVDYIQGANEYFVSMENHEYRNGGCCVWNQYLLLASVTEDRILAIDSESMEMKLVSIGANGTGGCMMLIPHENEIWVLPYRGNDIIRWNPGTGSSKKYDTVPETFLCNRRPDGTSCLERPFSSLAFAEDKVFIAPFWGNMFLCLDLNTESIEIWEPPFPIPDQMDNGYYFSMEEGHFIRKVAGTKESVYRYFSSRDCRTYDVDLKSGEYHELNVVFEEAQVREMEPGFSELSQWLTYGCEESSFNTIKNLLEGTISGSQFDQKRQQNMLKEIVENGDGSCGEKTHRFICRKLELLDETSELNRERG
ncbi:MAG: hypothetical protein ACK5ML_00485 [Lachnospiraceae bacterium]